MKKIKYLLRKIPLLNEFIQPEPSINHGKKGITQVGHRRYVGGRWEEIGKLQFNFLINEGLKPEHTLLDIACGSLRAGIHLIPYLNESNYLGLDKEDDLIKLGIKNELDPESYSSKKPVFVISISFEFHKFDRKIDFAIANSLFTHLPASHINLCLKNLKNVLHGKATFFATYFETENLLRNPAKPHDHKMFYYTREQMSEFGKRNALNFEYVGNWNHPRNQVMVKYTPLQNQK